MTLVGQGLSFAWVIQKLGLVDEGRREAAEAKSREVQARVKSIDAALARLDDPRRRCCFAGHGEPRCAAAMATAAPISSPACKDISEGNTAL